MKIRKYESRTAKSEEDNSEDKTGTKEDSEEMKRTGMDRDETVEGYLG